jgi:AAA15 family ATPase/GTPase
MLIEFTVGNFRSIAERVTLSMIAGPIKSAPYAHRIDEENVIRIDDRLSLLKTAAIYGANASGKSNLLKALLTMRAFMDVSVHGMDGRDGRKLPLPFTPFLLISGYQNEPSHFEIVFLMEGVQYRYGFEISASRVEKEWLYFVPTIREALLFQREGNAIKVGDSFKGGKGLEPRVAPQSLFLTVARDFNVKMAIDIFQGTDWFPAMSDGREESMFTIQSMEAKNLNTEIVDFMTRLDVGISDIIVSELPQKNGEEDIEAGRNRPKSYHVETIHTTYDRHDNSTSQIKFNMVSHESDGTQKLFSMSGKIVEVLKHGHILVVDEMDGRLHPALTRKIVELFHSKESNPKNAQLIFATHDTNLLDNRLFRRDQIWFTEKNRMGATTLYSLAELKVRNDAFYERDYIEGRYGAIPFPGRFDHIFNQMEVSDVGKG